MLPKQMVLTRTMLCFVMIETMVGMTIQVMTDSDFGKFRKVVVAGSCHSRCMMMDK